MIQTRSDDANTADEVLSPVRVGLEFIVGADAPVHETPVDALVDRTRLTAEEVSRLPGDLRDLHACLVKAPEGMTDVTFDVPLRDVSTRRQAGRA